MQPFLSHTGCNRKGQKLDRWPTHAHMEPTDQLLQYVHKLHKLMRMSYILESFTRLNKHFHLGRHAASDQVAQNVL